MNIPKETLIRMYLEMVTIRLYEETMAEAYQEGKYPVFNIASGPVPGEMHLAAGQEPVAVGVCMHLKKEDAVVGTHRPHHFAIAKGVDLKRMTAEIFGKVTGLGRGKGGHMHLFDPDVHFSCSGIVGASIPQAVGAALTFKMRKEKRVAVAFFGEIYAMKDVIITSEAGCYNTKISTNGSVSINGKVKMSTIEFDKNIFVKEAGSHGVGSHVLLKGSKNSIVKILYGYEGVELYFDKIGYKLKKW